MPRQLPRPGLMRTVRKRDQRGVALISVMLVFALASLLIGQMVVDTQRDQKRALNHSGSRQAFWYAMGGETLARQLLFEDFSADKAAQEPADGRAEAWAAEQRPFAIESGELCILIKDLQGRFNVNSILQNGAVEPLALARFERLLAALGLPIELADALADWFDTDNQARPRGAEDPSYSNRSEAAGGPILTGKQPLGDISELRLLEGMTDAFYHTLLPTVAALPAAPPPPNTNSGASRADMGLINVNSADEAVLQTLADSSGRVINAATAQQIVRGQTQRTFTQMQQFATFLKTGNSPIISGGITFQSRFFEVMVASQYAGRWSYLRSTLDRNPDTGALTVLQRSLHKAPLAPYLFKEFCL